MAKVKRGILYILASMLCVLTCLFFAACGSSDKYKNVSLTTSTQAISLYVGQTTTLEFKIENYIEDMDNTLSYAITDSSSSSVSSEHISVKTISNIENVIVAEITGLSSGRSTLVATTNEGFKQARVDIIVKQYSKTFDIDSTKIMYVSKGDVFYPSSNYFKFDEGTTERDLEFYFSEDGTDNIEGKKPFSYITFDSSNKILLYDKDGNLVKDAGICATDGHVYKFVAVYTFKEIDDTGIEVLQSTKKVASFVALHGINQDKVQVYESENLESIIDKENYNIDIVVRRTTSDVKEYFVTVPKMVDSISVDFALSYDVGDYSALNVQGEKYTDLVEDIEFKNKLLEDNLDLYKVVLSAKTSTATSTNLILKVFYSFSDKSDFSQEFNDKVNYVLYLPVQIKLMPEKLEIENVDKNVITGNNFVGGNVEDELYYNFYAGADYGWNEYYVNVYKTSSTFTGIEVQFDYTRVQIRYGGRLYNDTFIMTDVSQPLYIKGIDGIEVSGERENILFTVKSDLFAAGDELKAVLNYQICDGASKIYYEDSYFQKNGISVSLSSQTNTFEGLYTEQIFKSFTLETQTPGIVSIGNYSIHNIDEKYFLKFDVRPIKTGKASYIVRLDNGVSVALAIDVVETFDDFTIELDGVNDDVVVFEKSKDEFGVDIDGMYELVLKNSNSVGGKTATFKFSTTYMQSILAENLRVEIDNLSVVSLGSSTKDFVKTLTTTAKGGETVVKFVMTGTAVEDFKKSSQTKEISLNVVSFVPVSDIVANVINPITMESKRADKVVVYAKAESSAENTATLEVITNPSTAYSFYDVSTSKYVNDGNAKKYIYWTLSDGIYAYSADEVATEKNPTPISTICNKGIYYISGRSSFSENSYYGIFEYNPTNGQYKFTANQSYSSGASFTMYASIRQYGLKKYFPVNISCEKFVSVDKIYLGSEITEYAFKNADEVLEFVTYLNPFESTKKDIRLIYEPLSGETLIDVTDENLVKVIKQDTTTTNSYIVQVKLSSEVVSLVQKSNNSHKGILYVVPEDWCGIGKDFGAVAVDKRNQVVAINISFQNGSYENPYVLNNVNDVQAITSSDKGLEAHYIVYKMIDLSTLALPIKGDFSGTIRGANEKSGFRNISLVKEYSLFENVKANKDNYYNFENLIFEGTMDLNKVSNGNIGLIAQTFSGKALNITVSLTDNSQIETTKITTTTLNIGSAFGLMTGGEILQDFTRHYINISGAYYSSANYVKKDNDYKVSPFVADNENYFKFGVDYYLISNNTVEINGNKYDIFNVVKTIVYSTSLLDISGLIDDVNVGGIVGQMTGGKISQVYNDKLQYANYASYSAYTNIKVSHIAKTKMGGVVGLVNGNATLDNLKVGGQVKFNISQVTDASTNNFVGGIIGYIAKSCSVTNNISRVFVCGYNVGGIAGGKSDGVGMTAQTGNKVQAVDEDKGGIYASLITKIREQAGTNEFYKLSDETYVTYVNRTYKNVQVNITTSIKDNEYFGDYIVVVPSGTSGNIVYSEIFTKDTTGLLEVNVKNRTFDTYDHIITFAYYYKASAYFKDGELVHTNLIEKQELLNKLNTYSTDDMFTVSGEGLLITSESENISIDSHGNITLLNSSREPAEIVISSILNKREKKIIYLYVINYFNANDYLTNVTENIFYLTGRVVTSSTGFSVIASKNLTFTMNPRMKDVNKGIEDDKIISIENQAIQLASANEFIDYDVVFDESVHEDEAYGEIEKYQDGFFFSKKANAETTKDSYDSLDINVYLSVNIGGHDYKLSLTSITDVEAHYYEGATDITSNYASYVVVTGEKTRDKISIVSDVEEKLHYVITDTTGRIITKGYIEGSTPNITINGLFSVTGSAINNVFDVEISVDKESVDFKNRFTKNIYGKYFVKYYSESKGEDEIYLQMPINFEEQDVNTINIDSYNNLEDYLTTGNVYESEYVALKEYGLLSVSLSPIDADFDYVVIENDTINYADESAPASLVLGLINDKNEFETIYTTTPTTYGISVTKDNLEKAYGNDYNGQFFIRYLFSSTKAINDAPVKINVEVFKNRRPICDNSIDLKINRTYQIGLRLNGYENKEYIARGLSYELEVINAGYDADSVEVIVPEAFEDFASVRDVNGQLYLDVSNAELNITNGNKGRNIEIEIKVERKNSKGETEYEVAKLPLTILDYVINYKYEEGVNADVISGMENGIVSTAVGEAVKISANFKDYALIEYNEENVAVRKAILSFIDSLDKNGSWKVYLDINDLNVKIYDNIEADPNKANEKTISTGAKLDNIYFLENGLTFRTKKTHSPEDNHYIFTYNAKYVIENGGYRIADANDATPEQIKAQFTFDSFIRGSDENPNPITNYTEFKNMKEGANYILMNDIRITSDEFEPVSTAIASFDGNGYKFIFSNFDNKENTSNQPSVFDCTTISEIGLFSNVARGTVIKNVTVQIGDENSGNVVFKLMSGSSVTVGFIASNVDAGGVVTNAHVYNHEDVEVSLTDNQEVGSIMGAVIGSNSGFITHSRSALSFACNFSCAGFVGMNTTEGLIASSYFKGGKIKNDVSLATTNIYTAGFVVNNSGTISTSYTSQENASIKYEQQLDWNVIKENADIASAVLTAGFAYKNSEDGVIKDCYSNLRLRSSTNTAGFIYENEGKCRNAISFSLVNPDLNSQYGFAAISIRPDGFENCYYLRDAEKKINTAQNFVNINGVSEMNLAKFGVYKNFTTFSISNGENLNYVWNYLSELGRIELVDANMIAFSQKLLNVDNTTYAPDGTPIYDYMTAETSEADGTATNPYIISNPVKFENYISNGNTSGKYYRVVCDLNYDEYDTNFASSYDIAFGGYLYGNGMVINDISLYSDESLEYAGLFAKIQGTTFKNACVKDLAIIPKQVSFTNAKVVGGLCGLVSQADIINISVLGNDIVEEEEEEEPDEEEQEVISVVIGKNIVGGVVGLGQGEYTIDNVTIKISTMAKNIALVKENLLPTQNESLFLTSYLDYMSYAGGAVGFLGGYGTLTNVTVKKSGVTTIGASAGNVTGFIGKNTAVKNVEVNMNKLMITRAFVYGGIVSGITYGAIENVNIIGTGEDLELFSSVPYMPLALGGVTGYLTGMKETKVSNVYMGQSLVMPYEDGFTTKAPSYVGGIAGEVGRMCSAEVAIEKVKIAGGISTTFILGGVVGTVDAYTTLRLSEVMIDEVTLKLSGRNAHPVLANFVGLAVGYVDIKDAYSFAILKIDCFEYEKNIQASIGELIGKTDSLSTTLLNSSKILEVENIYTKNTYDVFLVDKSAVDPAVTVVFDQKTNQDGSKTPYQEAIEGRKIEENGNKINNIFTEGFLSGFTYRQNKSDSQIASEEITVGYYRLISLDDKMDLEKFASEIEVDETKDKIWQIERDENGKIKLIILNFENNF